MISGFSGREFRSAVFSALALFCLTIAASAQTPPVSAPAAAQPLSEVDVWRPVMHSREASDYVHYLQLYPAGNFATLAKLRLADLHMALPQALPGRVSAVLAASSHDLELLFWASIAAGKKPAEYQAYLNAYPNGEFVELARLRVRLFSGPVIPLASSLLPANIWGVTGNPPAAGGNLHAELLGNANWLQSQDSGCWIYNADPRPGQTALWYGDCVDGYISGDGLVLFYTNGTLSQVSHKTFKEGQGFVDPALVEAREIPILDRVAFYPQLSLRMHETGMVNVLFLVGPDGYTSNVRVVTSSGKPRLDDAAAQYVSASQYIPARRNGQFVQQWRVLNINWQLQ